MKKLSVKKSSGAATSTQLSTASLVNGDFMNIEKPDTEDGKSPKTGTRSRSMSKKTSWIYHKFRKRSCRQFICSNKHQDRCYCGRLEEQHKSEALRSSENGLQTEWKVSEHTVLEPTDAYGELEFQGAGQASRAKYVRIAHDTNPELVLSLLQSDWNLELPKLLISVTGGAKNFVLHPKLKQVLRQGLLKAAKTTGAWIFTGGTNTGVMRHVGEAVRGHSVTSRRGSSNDSHQVRLIGIATWGIVNEREVLIGNKDLVCYPMTSSMVSAGASLDNNHSHFLLVDDGTVGKYGGEITFRACLENCISNKKIYRNKDHGVPVVMLVLEGGPNTIRTVLESVNRNPAVPVVVAEGSGRAADVLAYAHKFVAQTDNSEFNEMADVVEHRHLLFKIEKAFPECNDEACVQIYENVLKCVSNKRYITVFSVNEGGVDIDRAILRALLRGQNASAADQLSLALIWNRADIAKSEIFTEDQKWNVRDLEPIMRDALINNRVEFVKLLLENGVCMPKFLTVRRLEDLYQARLKYSVTLRHLLGEQKKQSDFRLADLPCVFQHLLRINFKADSCDAYGSVKKGIRICITNNELFNNSGQYSSYLPHPFNDLLIWAVLTNMQNMALFMWERDDESMAKALVAGSLYKAMARELARDEMKVEICDKLKENAREFLQLSLGILNECFQTNEELAQQLLTYNLENWGSQTCLALAVATEHEEFVAHTCCQKLLTEIWVGAMRIGNWASLQTVLGILFPPFIFSLEFKNSRQLSYLPVTYEEFIHNRELVPDDEELTDGEASGTASFTRQGVEGDEDDEANVVFRTPTRCSSSESLGLNNRISDLNCDMVDKGKTLGLWRCLYEFYRAPITKFWGNVIVYLLFLALFSFVILVRLEATPSVPECVLIVFVFTLCIEEVRQILQWEHSSLLLKLKEWASNNWNICDGVAVIMFFVAVGLRMHPATISAGHVIYCIDAMVWIIRLLDIFSVSKNLGPYVVMIGRMTVDMAYFLIIMVVFLLAYGVAQQALLYPNSSPSWTLISGMFYRPYFQIYGELFFVDGGHGDANTTMFGTPKYDNHGSEIVVAIMAFYLLVANILLLNLLIAIFNNTFSAVQENSEQIWKYNRYHLIMEYASRPLLVPPFIILNHLYLLYKACRRGRWASRCCGKRNCSSKNDRRLKRFLNREERDKLMLFEEQCADVYMSNKDTLFHATHEERIRALGSRVACLSTQLQEMNKEVISKQEILSKATRALDCRSTRVEEYTVQILQLLANMQPLVPGLSDQTDETETETCPSTALPQTSAGDSRCSPWVFPAPGSGSVKPYRMMSVPAHVHQRQMSRQLSGDLTEGLEAPLYPTYFRRKFPQLRTQSVEPKGNTRRGSVIEAVQRFRRNTLPNVLDQDTPVHDVSDVTVSESSTDHPQEDGGVQTSSFDAVTLLRSKSASDPVESQSVVDAVDQLLRNQRSMTVTLPSRPKLPSDSSTRPRDAYDKARSLGLHVRTRQSPYPQSTKQRYPVPDFLVDWQMPFPGYCPPMHTSETVLAKPDWADFDIMDPAYQDDIRLNFNDLDGPVDRRSYFREYDVVNGIPRNPKGRTGMCGRGLLGRWGPNHAADPIVTRWKMTSEGKVMIRLGKPVLEFVAIERKDNREWALPGGMVEAGDTVSKTLKKEFSEEALCSQDASVEERERIAEQLEAFFSCGLKVYVGYVDDPRNTDNSWIETAALNFHDENGETLRSVELKAGDDASGVEWQEVSGNTRLYANHSYMLRQVAELHNAYF